MLEFAATFEKKIVMQFVDLFRCFFLYGKRLKVAKLDLREIAFHSFRSDVCW